MEPSGWSMKFFVFVNELVKVLEMIFYKVSDYCTESITHGFACQEDYSCWHIIY